MYKWQKNKKLCKLKVIILLTPRLNLIKNQVKGSTVADIGTDHGFIPIELVKKGICKKAIASDINKGPAAIAKGNIEKEGLTIDVRVGGGLSVLEKGEVEEIIIAGMGGKLISDIISDHMDIAESARLILQPMNSQYELRKFLTENEFYVEHEDLALEGFKVYNVIVCSKKVKKPVEYNSELDFHIPEILKSHMYFNNLKEKKIREFSKIINGYKLSKGPIDRERLEYFENLLSKIKEL